MLLMILRTELTPDTAITAAGVSGAEKRTPLFGRSGAREGREEQGSKRGRNTGQKLLRSPFRTALMQGTGEGAKRIAAEPRLLKLGAAGVKS